MQYIQKDLKIIDLGFDIGDDLQGYNPKRNGQQES